MSIAEELHKTIDELSEEQQQELLQTARQLLEESEPEEDNPEYQALLKELLIKRYEHHKAHPETSISAEDADRRIRLKYGWL
jgi:predicted outer membrane protein